MKNELMDENRVGSFDLLRMLASFLVVMLHVSAQGFYAVQPYWLTGVVYNAIGRIGVPIFFMMSGAFLLPKAETLKATAARTLKKIIIPYVVWGFIYMVYNAVTLGTPVKGLSMLRQAPYYHMGFMLQLLSFYLVLPVLRGFWQNPGTAKNQKLYVTLLALLAGILTDFIYPLIGKSLFGFTISYFPYYVGLALLGAYLRESKIYTRRWHLWIVGYLVCTAGMVYLTYYKSFMIGQPTEQFFLYQSPLTIAAAICVFLLFNQMSVPKKMGKYVKNGGVTLSIFLMHPLVLNLCASGKLGIVLGWNSAHPIFWIPLFSGLIFLTCFVLALFWKALLKLLITNSSTQ